MKQLNARQLARELNIRGWTCVRSNGGSHSQYRNPSSPKVITLAGHGARPIPPGLLRKILRDAGIDPSELRARPRPHPQCGILEG